MRAAIIRDSDGFVANLIVVEDLDHPVDAGHTLVATDMAGPGWNYDGIKFSPPPTPPPLPPADLTAEELASLLVGKNTITRAEINTIKTDRGKP